MGDYRRLSDGTVASESDTTAEARDAAEREKDRDKDRDKETIKEVRASDIEPYTGLRYLSKLFRFMAVILVLLLVAEVATGVYTQGSAALPTLLGEASRLIVLAGVLWGTGDLAHLLIDVGHDVRAARILVARVAHAAKVAPLSATRVTVNGESTVPERAIITPPPERKGAPVIERTVTPRRNFADRIDNGDDGPPIP